MTNTQRRLPHPLYSVAFDSTVVPSVWRPSNYPSARIPSSSFAQPATSKGIPQRLCSSDRCRTRGAPSCLFRSTFARNRDSVNRIDSWAPIPRVVVTRQARRRCRHKWRPTVLQKGRWGGGLATNRDNGSLSLSLLLPPRKRDSSPRAVGHPAAVTHGDDMGGKHTAELSLQTTCTRTSGI